MGAPWLDGQSLARSLEKEKLEGVGFRPTSFTPTFQKHVGRLCHGVQVHVRDRKRFSAFLTYLLLIHHARAQSPEQFAWRDPPYEYEYVKPPFDILSGTNLIRQGIEAGRSPRKHARGWKKQQDEFRRRRRPYLLY